MLITYRAVLRGDRLVWREAPPQLGPDEAEVPVYVTLIREDDPDLEARRERVRQLLEQLVELGAFAEIEDPVAWQREIRQDRPLPWDN